MNNQPELFDPCNHCSTPINRAATIEEVNKEVFSYYDTTKAPRLGTGRSQSLRTGREDIRMV